MPEVDDSNQFQPEHPVTANVPFKLRLNPIAKRSLSNIPQDNNVQLSLLNDHHVSGQMKFQGTKLAKSFLKIQDPTLRAVQWKHQQKLAAEELKRQKANFHHLTNLPDVSIQERETAIELEKNRTEWKATILKSFYNPSMPLAPEMSFNLGRKTHKEYLEMKRESVLKKD